MFAMCNWLPRGCFPLQVKNQLLPILYLLIIMQQSPPPYTTASPFSNTSSLVDLGACIGVILVFKKVYVFFKEEINILLFIPLYIETWEDSIKTKLLILGFSLARNVFWTGTISSPVAEIIGFNSEWRSSDRGVTVGFYIVTAPLKDKNKKL